MRKYRSPAERRVIQTMYLSWAIAAAFAFVGWHWILVERGRIDALGSRIEAAEKAVASCAPVKP